MNFGSPSQVAPPALPPAPPPAPVFGNSPVGSKPQARSTQTTFIGSAALPPPSQSNAGFKTLLGQ